MYTTGTLLKVTDRFLYFKNSIRGTSKWLVRRGVRIHEVQTLNFSLTRSKVPEHFFEGAEKLLSVWFTTEDGKGDEHGDLKKIPREKWDELVRGVDADILSEMEDEDVRRGFPNYHIHMNSSSRAFRIASYRGI